MNLNFDNDMPKAKLPSSINVLTILTFIGSTYEFVVGGVVNYFSSEFLYKETLKNAAIVNSTDAPAFVKSLSGPEMLALSKANFDHRLEILIIYTIGAALCIIGAIMMRKFNFKGLYIYLLGVWGTIGAYIFVVGNLFSGFKLIALVAVPVIMTILYLVFSRDIRKSVVEEN